MSDRWSKPESIPDFMECPSHILVWNDCNGVSQISVDPDDIYRFRAGTSGWLLWRNVPKPSAKDIARALKESP